MDGQHQSMEFLLADIARGRRDALRPVYDAQASRMFGVAMAILRDREAAADAVHDAFLKIAGRAGQYDSARGPAAAWMMGIVRNAALEPRVLEGIAEQEDGRRLQECLDQLDAHPRGAILLAFVHGLSHPQIGERLKAPLGTVKSMIRRGLLRLRECMT